MNDRFGFEAENCLWKSFTDILFKTQKLQKRQLLTIGEEQEEELREGHRNEDKEFGLADSF